MTARIEYWRPNNGHVWHAFTCHTDYMPDGEPRWRVTGICDRHEFTLDSPSVESYTPWMKGTGPAKPLCAKCRKILEEAHV